MRWPPSTAWEGGLRPETRSRARVLQLLYAWDVRGRPPIDRVVEDLLRVHVRCRTAVELAERVARAVVADVQTLDARIADAVDNWRLQRVGIVEQNILRLALHELDADAAPPRVVISEAVKLAHWFAGQKAPSFVNGVLDGLARREGRL